jgi:hypothetical protein
MFAKAFVNQERMQFPNQHEKCVFDTIDTIWKMAKRPFFNVYPSVLECLKNTNINFTLDQINSASSVAFQLGAIEIRTKHFAFRFALLSLDRIRHLAHIHGNNHLDELTSSHDVEGLSFVSEKNGNIVGGNVWGADVINSVLDGWPNCNMEHLKIAIGCILLSLDDRFIEPILLNRDKNILPEKRQTAINRARKRGVIGFSIGKDIEISRKQLRRASTTLRRRMLKRGIRILRFRMPVSRSSHERRG